MKAGIITGCVVAVLAILYYNGLLFTTFTLFMHLAFGSLGLYLGVSWGLIRGKQYTPPSLPKELKTPHVRLVLQNMMEARVSQKSSPRKTVISRNLDLALQDVIDLVMRDMVLSWYKDLSVDHETLLTYLESDLWIVIENVSERLGKVDKVQFITQDVVQKLRTHFRDIRIASSKAPEDSYQKTFSLHPWLKSRDAELNFLRKVSEALLLVVLPKYYAKSPPIRHLLREVVANTILKPTIEMLCDPDYINGKLISYIEYREKVSEDTRRTYTYAATYEDFVKMIKKSEDIEHLKQLRFNIMTEIMQATTIEKLKKSKTTEKKESPKKSTAKGELLKQRNLKRYVNQLTVAKSCCERRIHRLSGPDYKYYYKYYTSGFDDSQQQAVLPGEKVLPFAEIMQSVAGREAFDAFLERDNNESLLGFWNGVEKLRHSDKKQHHHIGTDIYQRYISCSTSVVKVDKPTIKGMETFMLGDTGPEAFFSAQESVYAKLEEKHYPSFLVSDLYHRYLTSVEESSGEATGSEKTDTLLFPPTEDEEEDEEMFSLQCYHAKQKLQQLDAKITNKAQAFEALRISKPRADKLQKVQEEMEGELEAMHEEKRRLESHILRTEQWCANTGRWRAHVYGAETEKQGDKTVPVFVLVIHLSGSNMSSQNLQSSHQGWVVNRRLQDFNTVHEKLVQIAGSWLKNKELPKVSMFTTVDDKFLREAKDTLNDYLTAVMKDERLSHSEALYGFLTPTPEYFQQPGEQKKSEFFLKTFLKSLPSIGQDSNREGEEDLLFSYDERTEDPSKDSIVEPLYELINEVYNHVKKDKTEDRSKDSIAEPLYGLINEVYELTGMFKWLRKNFIAFVEISFGRSINRQLRETVDWIFSEPMIIYYIRNLKDSMWPGGVMADAAPSHSDEEKLQTRLKAKEKFLQIQPDAIKNLVGEENARRGTIKMFEVLQDVRLNKHLLYELLLLLMDRMIPELKALMDEQVERAQSVSPVIINSSDQSVEVKA